MIQSKKMNTCQIREKKGLCKFFKNRNLMEEKNFFNTQDTS